MKHRIALVACTIVLAGCSNVDAQTRLPHIGVGYHNARCGLTLSLPTAWRAYSVLVQQWEGQTYLPDADKVVVTEHGPLIVLLYPLWNLSNLYQDFPILVFTRRQWEASYEGRFSVGADGVEYEIGYNSNFVFTISSRFNADDSFSGWKEATEIVERNQAANGPHLFPE